MLTNQILLAHSIVFDRGGEFVKKFANMVIEDYRIKRKPMTKKNPQVNAIIERIHQTVGNSLRTLNKQDIDKKEPLLGILAAVMFAIIATYYITTQAIPAQLVFGRDAVLNTVFQANWKYVEIASKH